MCNAVVSNFNQHLLNKHGFTTAEYNAACNIGSVEEPADKYYACPRCSYVQCRIERHIQVCYKFGKSKEALERAKEIKNNDCRRVSKILIQIVTNKF